MTMPSGPKGERRPADVNARAVLIAEIATGEIEDAPPDDEKDPAAKASERQAASTARKAQAILQAARAPAEDTA